MNVERLALFHAAYKAGVIEAVKIVKPELFDQTPEEYAADIANAMMTTICTRRLGSIGYHVINTTGGAIKYACDQLGIGSTLREIENYLEGR